MTISGVSVDCGWLVGQDSADAVENHEVMLSIEHMRKNGLFVLVDHARKIMSEYERNLASNTFGRKLFTHLMKFKMIYFVDGSPTKACTKCLDRNHFDLSDRPYIAVAQHGGGAYITHESKHHEPTRVLAIQSRCNVPILDTQGFIDLMR